MKEKQLAFLLVFYLCLVSKITAQQGSLAVSAPIISVIVNPDSSETRAKVTLRNTANRKIRITWERKIHSLTSGWQVQICDAKGCTKNYMSQHYIDLSAGASVWLEVGVRPNKTQGNANVELHLYEVGNPKNTANVRCTFATQITNTGGSQAVIYPNPVSNFFQIQNNDGVEKVIIYNILGKPVRTLQITEGGRYDISDLPEGVYMMSMMNGNGQVVKSVRLNKSKVKA